MSKKSRKKRSPEHAPTKKSESPPAIVKRPFLYNPIFHISLIILLGFLAYSNTFHSSFVFDDINNIVQNHRIKDISNIPSFFTHIEGAPISGRPLTVATFAINYRLGGLNTTGYHIINLILHIANGILLYLLIRITAGYLNNADVKKTSIVALFSSLIFVVHPIQTESVTYIISRSVLLSTSFFFLGIILFTKATGAEGRRRILYTTLLVIISLLGMASREEFFLFPLMLILYDLYFVSKQEVKTVLRHWKIHLPVILTLSYVLYIVMSYDYQEHAGFGVKTITPLQYLLTQFNVHWTYIRLLFLPINQNLDYDYPIARTLFEFPTIISFIGYLGLWGAGFFLYRRRSVISFCILWFMITLFPSSSFMPIKDVIFEHRLYVPLVGIFIATTASGFFLADRFVNRWPKVNKVTASIFVFIILFLVSITYERNIIWQDDINLWADVILKSPGKARGYNNRGFGYFKKGHAISAIEDISKAIDIDQNLAEAYSNRGVIYSEIGYHELAIKDFTTEIAVNPNHVSAYYNRGLVYFKEGQYDKGIEDFTEAIKLNPQYIDAYNNRGLAYYKIGQIDNAIQDFSVVISTNPGYADAYHNRGIAYGDKGLFDKAADDMRRSKALRAQYGSQANR